MKTKYVEPDAYFNADMQKAFTEKKKASATKKKTASKPKKTTKKK